MQRHARLRKRQRHALGGGNAQANRLELVRVRKNLRGRSLGKHRTLVHHNDTVTTICQFIHAVRNHDNRQALAMESTDEP